MRCENHSIVRQQSYITEKVVLSEYFDLVTRDKTGFISQEMKGGVIRHHPQ